MVLWTPAEERYYVDYLVQGKRQGEKGEDFKSPFFKAAVREMQLTFPYTTSSRLNSKRAEWKRKFGWYLKLLIKTGYTFNQETGWFHAEPECWDTLQSSGLGDLLYFRSNPMTFHREFHEIWGDNIAKGKVARAARARYLAITEGEGVEE